MTQYSRYGSAKGTTWAYWERIKSIWKPLWVPLSSHVTGIWDSCTLIVLSIRDYILFIVPLLRFHYRKIQFEECGVRHTWGASKRMTTDDAMTQVHTCSWTKAGHSLKYSSFVMLLEAPPPPPGMADEVIYILFLKPNWSPLVGLYLRSSYVNTACPATETAALMIMSKVLFRCFQLLHNAFRLRFHFRLTFSNPLHCSRQSALVLSLYLKKHRGSALKVYSLWVPSSALDSLLIPLSHLPAISRRPLCALGLLNIFTKAQWNRQNMWNPWHHLALYSA